LNYKKSRQNPAKRCLIQIPVSRHLEIPVSLPIKKKQLTEELENKVRKEANIINFSFFHKAVGSKSMECINKMP